MDIFEIAGYSSAVARDGVNFLEPSDAFQTILNGYIYRQELLSRFGFFQFSNSQLLDATRVLGIFEHTKPDNTIVCLVITKNFLYIYNDITNHFDQIPMAGSAPIGGFAIPSQDDYVSGTTYPFPDGSERFVFTGKGMSDVYMYNGTNVQSFTLDNPNYAPPPMGAINKAQYVTWFGERLNFFVPFINGAPQRQMVLYSGIRTTSGNGDKFNVPGSGNLSADTYEYITGATIAGDYMLINFNQSSWTLEKTRDAFNPYFFRQIPGVLGTDAMFSAATWNNNTKSIGKPGIITSDGRQNLRTDDKIPYFTRDEIDQIEFNQTYGGFDRINAQFLFAYRDTTSNLTAITQDKVLVNNYEESTWAINDQRFSVFGQTDSGQNLAMNDIYEANNPSWLRMDTTEDIWNKVGIGEATQKTLAGDDNGFVYEINIGYQDYYTPITGITNDPQAIISLADSAYEIGDVVTISNVVGMTEINYLQLNVLDASLNSITVDFDASGASVYTSEGSVSKFINFYAETIPFNPYRDQGRKVILSHVEFLLNTNAGNLTVEVYEDEEESPFKTVFMQPTSTLKAREWMEMVVNQEANFITFALSQSSISAQVIITSMRIHCSMGGLTTS